MTRKLELEPGQVTPGSACGLTEPGCRGAKFFLFDAPALHPPTSTFLSMGYRGGNNFDERDKLFGAQSGDRTKAKKNLDALFTSKAADKCADGHQWIRDFDRRTKCARCRTLKPAE